MPQEVMIFKEKHGDRIFVTNSDEDQYKVALKVLSERLKAGYWFDPHESKEVRSIVEAQDGKKALVYLKMRNDKDYEYESLYIETPEPY